MTRIFAPEDFSDLGEPICPEGPLIARAFGETANPDEYIPRPACEAVLRELEHAVFEQEEPAALIAPPGMGKSLLLRVFAQRCEHQLDVVELAYGAMPFEDLCEWTLRLLGEEVGADPREDFGRRLKERNLLLAIDDASSLPHETTSELAELVRMSSPRLRVVLVAADGFAASRMLAAFGEPCHPVRLMEPMDEAETRSYLARRLDRQGATPETLDRLRPGSVTRLLRLSGGVPRRVHAVAQQVLVEIPPSVNEEWREESWLGAPLDELGPVGD